MIQVIHHSDPSHDWYEVSSELVKRLDIKVSQYSYKRRGRVYLESDSDAESLFLALRELGLPFEVIEGASTEGPSPIRDYTPF